jgi:methyl-accepting chemotaxis protein
MNVLGICANFAPPLGVSVMFHTIKSKITALVLVATILPFVFTSTIALIASEVSLQASFQQKLEAVRDIKRNALNDSFTTMASQIKVLSSNNATVNAMYAFDSLFEGQALPATISQKTIVDFWQKQLTHDTSQASQTETDVLSLFNKLSPRSQLFQQSYLINNAEKSRQNLVLAKNNFGYDRAHKEYHPWFHKFIDQFEYSDVYLINTKGNVVYSV